MKIKKYVAIVILMLSSAFIPACNTQGVKANDEWQTQIDKGAAWQADLTSRVEAKASAAEAGKLSEEEKTSALRFAADGAKISSDQWLKIQQASHGIYPSETATTQP